MSLVSSSTHGREVKTNHYIHMRGVVALATRIWTCNNQHFRIHCLALYIKGDRKRNLDFRQKWIILLANILNNSGKISYVVYF